MQFDPVGDGVAETEFVAAVRDFLRRELPADRSRPPLSWFADSDLAFSRKMASAGLLGLGLPDQYGGKKATAVERFLVFEEMWAVSAPVNGHLVSERQTGQCMLRYGSETLKERFLPKFAKGEVSFSLGFSEPDAGSDLASVRTSATKIDGGWLVNGTKVWTTFAHLHDYFTVLARTSASQDRHQGLSQLIVDLHASGVQINPILFPDGTHHFNEVVLTDVFVEDDMVLGEINMGWSQAVQELAYERASPDRYMTAFPLLEAFVREQVTSETSSDLTLAATGSLVARFWAIRNLSLALVRQSDFGVPAGPEAALTKDLATSWVQEMIETARGLYPHEVDPDSPSELESYLARATCLAPTATLAGGSVEVLRSLASRGLRGISDRVDRARQNLLDDTIVQIFRDRATMSAILSAEQTGWSPELWDVVAEAGLPWIGVPQDAGGSGGSLIEALSLLRWSGYFAVPLPIAECGLLGGWLLSGAGLQIPAGPVSVAPGDSRDWVAVRREGEQLIVSGRLHRVPWAASAQTIITLAEVEGTCHVLAIPKDHARIKAGRNMAFEPREQVTLEEIALTGGQYGPASPDASPWTLKLRGALGRAAQTAGACQGAADLAVDYARERRAFGRPIAQFQAVQHHLVRAAADAELAATAATVAAQAFPSPLSPLQVAAAKVVACRAARTVASATHQTHGAIGMTREYQLHPRTRRMWSWSDEYGSEAFWSRWLGELVGEIGAERLWIVLSAAPGVGEAGPFQPQYGDQIRGK
jgi:alkylation response protein AidB-like acyl-CoA dehydrogenase